MKIRFSSALTLLSSLTVFACSAADAGDGSGSVDAPPPVVEETRTPTTGQPAQPAPSAKRPHRSSRVSAMTAPALSSLRNLGATVSTDKTSYAYGEPITVSFANLPGNIKDWVDFAPVGSADTVYSWYAYTVGATSGTVTTAAGDFLPPGTYVARAFPDDTYNRAAQSVEFTVGAKPALTATVSADKTTYGGFDMIHATFSNATANANLRISIHQPYGSTGTEFAHADVQADANGSGSVDLRDIVAGDFEIRVFEGTTWTGTSAQFHVDPAVRTDKTTYTVGEQVRISFAGMQALSMQDAVAIAVAGSESTAYVSKTYVDWYWSGWRQLGTTDLAPGTYTARVFFDYSSTAKAESTTFTITAAP